MCGRFTATFEFSDIRVRWNLDRDLPLYKPRFNVAPEIVGFLTSFTFFSKLSNIEQNRLLHV